MAPIWKAPRDANCNSKISIFKYTLQLIPGEKHFPPLMGMLSVVLRKKVESVLLNERKFAARSSSPRSLRGLPFSSASCCAAFLWVQVRARANWNGRGKRHRLMAIAFITSSTWASVKVIIYTCRCPAGPMLSVDQVHAVSPGQTGILYWHLGLLRVRQEPIPSSNTQFGFGSWKAPVTLDSSSLGQPWTQRWWTPERASKQWVWNTSAVMGGKSASWRIMWVSHSPSPSFGLLLFEMKVLSQVTPWSSHALLRWQTQVQSLSATLSLPPQHTTKLDDCCQMDIQNFLSQQILSRRKTFPLIMSTSFLVLFF